MCTASSRLEDAVHTRFFAVQSRLEDALRTAGTHGGACEAQPVAPTDAPTLDLGDEGRALIGRRRALAEGSAKAEMPSPQ